jgi:hypothetical protein
MILHHPSSDGDGISNTHNLMHVILGRILVSRADDSSDEGWKEHILSGKHATELISQISKIDQEEGVDTIYDEFCKYMRAVILTAARYDTESIYQCEDIRFLRWENVGTVNHVRHKQLCQDIISFYCSLLIFRKLQSDEQVEATKTFLMGQMDYKHTLELCMALIQEECKAELREA